MHFRLMPESRRYPQRHQLQPLSRSQRRYRLQHPPPNAAVDATTCCAGSALAGACSCAETALVVSWASTALDCWSAAESANETAGVPKPKRVMDSVTASALRLNDHSCLAWRVAATFDFPLVMISPVLHTYQKTKPLIRNPVEECGRFLSEPFMSNTPRSLFRC